MKFTTVGAILLLIIASAAFSGCLQSGAPAGEQGTFEFIKVSTEDPYTAPEGIVISTSNFEKHYLPDPEECYWEGYVHVTNNRPSTIQYVMVRCYLKEKVTGTTVDSTSKHFEIIQSGEKKTFQTKLYGKCAGDYRIDVKVSEE